MPRPTSLKSWISDTNNASEVSILLAGFAKHPTPSTLAFVFSVLAAKDFPISDRPKVFEGIVDILRNPVKYAPGLSDTNSGVNDPTANMDTKDIAMTTRAILTPAGVTSFLNLAKPRAVVLGGEERFSLNLIFDKAAQHSAAYQELQKACDEAIKERWPGKVPPGLRSPFRDAGEKEGTYDGYVKGDVFIAPWSKNKPGCVNRERQEILDFSEFYAGWTARAFVRPFAYETSGNRGVGMFLDVVQFLKPGKRLDGRKNATEAFPDDQAEDEDERV